jgi:type III secretory pathway component EscV
MFPDGAATEGVAEMINEAIPAMRDRILQDTGVLVPGVRVRASEALPGGAFTVRLHGVPYAGGRVPEGARLCIDPQACHELGLTGEPFENAWTGSGAAVWLDLEQAVTAEGAGLVLLDAYDAMLWSLERLVRANLWRLVGLAEVDYIVEEWRTELPALRSELVASVLPNQRARIGFAAMIRRLAAEQISVTDLGGLLDIYASVGGGPAAVEDAVEAARSPAPKADAAVLEGSLS